jgi:hypothetical protein
VIVGTCHATMSAADAIISRAGANISGVDANISEADAIINSNTPCDADARAISGTLDAIAPARPACGHGVRRSLESFHEGLTQAPVNAGPFVGAHYGWCVCERK